MDQTASGIADIVGTSLDPSLMIGIVGLILAVVVLIVTMVIFWTKMDNVVSTSNVDIKQLKKLHFDHIEESRLFQRELLNFSKIMLKNQEAQHSSCESHEKKLYDVTSLLQQQQNSAKYMEKIWEEIKRLVENSTQATKELKTFLEREYGKSG